MARSVRCRSGTSRRPLTSRPRECSSRARIAAGGSSFTRAAASSIASGSPSRRSHDFRDRRRVLVGDGEAGHRGGRPRREQLHRLALRRPTPPRRRGPAAGTCSGGHRELLLPRQVQRRAAGDQDPRPGGGGEQIGDEPARGEHLLEVVQDQQDVPLREVAAQVFQQRRARARPATRCRGRSTPAPAPGPAPPPATRNARPCGKVLQRPARQLDRQPRLAAAARPGQRQQPGAGQQASRLRPARSPGPRNSSAVVAARPIVSPPRRVTSV